LRRAALDFAQARWSDATIISGFIRLSFEPIVANFNEYCILHFLTAEGELAMYRIGCGVFVAAAMLATTSAAFSQVKEPGGTPEDVKLAITSPHEYAWQLFMFLNRQAKPGTAGEADPTKNSLREYDADKDVVWETWANATGGLFLRQGEANSSEVYKEKGADPGPWESLPRGTVVAKRLDPNTTVLFSNSRFSTNPMRTPNLQGGGLTTLAVPGVTVEGEFEVRMNKSTFNSIRKNKLYSVEGLIAAFERAKANKDPRAISFDLESKEVKGKWVKLTNEADKQRYHWRNIEVVNAAGNKVIEVWGLSGFHIVTKDLPMWFWTDFEHVDREPQAIMEGRPSIDPTTRGPGAPKGQNGIRDETKNSKWEFYRLRGVEITFTDQFGKNNELSNTLIEPISSGPSSCMTCHANATVSNVINHNQVGVPFMIQSLNPDFKLGVPDPTVYEQGGVMRFLQTDFLWSMAFRARSEK
jgi:hypothetical protein